jgi:hypothetical protein
VKELVPLKSSDIQVMQRREVKWQPLEEGWVKIISDGYFNVGLGQGVGAAVIRDHEGVVLAA